MIERSEAVAKYMSQHPDAFASKDKINETIKYLQDKVFRHDVNDPTKWDGNAEPDIWTSDRKWLFKNFNETDVLSSDGAIKSVISAAKKTEIESRAVQYGPNVKVAGIGETGDRGSWVIEKPDGTKDLCTEEVFNKTYKHSGPKGEAKLIRTEKGYDVMYPKGSMRYMSIEQLSAPIIDTSNKVSKFKDKIAQLETPIYRVLGNAICDYITQNPKNSVRMELEINSLISTDRNPLSLDGKNPKSERLKQLLADKIIDSRGAVINPKGLADSETLKNYKRYGVDLTQTETIRKLFDKSCDVNGKANNGRNL